MVRVMVVDDAVVFRSQIPIALKGIEGVEVVSTANNGKVALHKYATDPVDVMILDLEMPDMNGLETLREIARLKYNVKVVVFASRTADGANKALEALKLGAVSFVAKPGGDVSSLDEALEDIKSELIPAIQQFLPKKPGSQEFVLPLDLREIRTQTEQKPYQKNSNIMNVKPDVVCIGSSTGGPPALERLFSFLKRGFNFPILVTQHMPPVFTRILAERIAGLYELDVREAADGERLEMGQIYVAPGDFHMTVEERSGVAYIALNQEAKKHSVRPAVDFTFSSAVKVFGKGTFGFILTGMGVDGAEGCHEIKLAGGNVMIQDEESSVVWGMPGAVNEMGAFDKIGSIDECGGLLQQLSVNSQLLKKVV